MPEPGYIYEPDNPMMPRRLVVRVGNGRVTYRVERRRNANFCWGLPERTCKITVWDEWVSGKRPVSACVGAETVFSDMRVMGHLIAGAVLKSGFDAMPEAFAADDLYHALERHGATEGAYQAALRLVQRLRKAGLIVKRGSYGNGAWWRKTSQQVRQSAVS